MNETVLFENAAGRLLDVLAHLASATIQERYIVTGTPDNYLVPNQLLADLDGSLQFFRFERFPERLKLLNERFGRAAYVKLLELERWIDGNPRFLESYSSENLGTLVHQDSTWLQIRRLADEILQELDFDLQQWERENA
jgi:hypothetical protein